MFYLSIRESDPGEYLFELGIFTEIFQNPDRGECAGSPRNYAYQMAVSIYGCRAREADAIDHALKSSVFVETV